MRCCGDASAPLSAPACDLPLLLFMSLRSCRCGEASAARKVGRVLLVLYLVERYKNDLLAALVSRPCVGALAKSPETLLQGKRSLFHSIRRIDSDQHQRAPHNSND